MRLLRLTLLAAWRDTLDQWTWRSFMITLVLNQAIAPVIGFLVWRAVAPNSPEIADYFLMLLIVQLATVSYEDHTLASSIYTGGLVGELLQPQPILVPFLGANLGLRFWHLAFGLPIIVALALVTGTAPEPAAALAAVPALIIAGGLRFLFTTTVALTAFWTEQARNLVGLANTVIALGGGIAAPIFLLGSPYGEIARALPFWPMLGLPAEIAAGVLTGEQIAYGCLAQLGWLGIAGLAAAVVWRSGLRRFSAIGA